MPNAKQVQKTSDSWTLSDRVAELNGKYHLKRKDSDAYRESTIAEIRQKEKVIAAHRLENRKKRIALACHENGDELVIQTVFKDERTERFSLQRFTAEGAIEEMDQTMCERGKALNALRYEREKRERRLTELGQELERMERVHTRDPERWAAVESVTQLENMLDKALIQYDTAKIISQHYHCILEKLKEESLTLPAKLDAMELSLKQQKKELRELKVMSKGAIISKDEAKKDLSEIEQSAYEARKSREVELNTTRKEVERRKSEAEKLDKRTVRAQLISDKSDMRIQMEQQQKQFNQRRMLDCVEAAQLIKQAANVVELEDAVNRLMSQKETEMSLRTRAAELDTQRNRLKEERDKLKTSYHDMKYTGEQKLSKGQRLLEDNREHLDKEIKRHDRALERLERTGDTLLKVKAGMATLLDKLDGIKLQPPNHNYTQGDVFEQLALSHKKLMQLVRDLSTHVGIETVLRGEDQQQTELQGFLESQLPADNVRISVEKSETQLSEFDYDGQENEVLSRDNIKDIGQRLIDSKNKPKVKKGKK